MTVHDEPGGIRPGSRDERRPERSLARFPPSSDRSTGWTAVCDVSRLTADRGVAALVDGQAVAVFLLGTGELHAIDDVDPCSGASVLSRGLIGDVDGTATVASPMYKQRFALATGRCLDADVTVRVHDAHVIDDVVHVRLAR